MRKLKKAAVILLALIVVCYAVLVAAVYVMEQRAVPAGDGDCLIVLGAQVLPSGEPNLQLQYRLETTLREYQNNPCPIIVCGARGDNEPCTEAEAMSRWLVKNGVPETDVLEEGASFNTRQNLLNAMAIMDAHGLHTANIVTSDYHLARALAYAKDVGLNAGGFKAPCKPGVGYWLKNHCREALAWVKYWLISGLGMEL